MTDNVSASPAQVVALHSSFFDGTIFDGLQRALGCPIYAPSHRGQNGVPKGERPITMETLAEDLLLDLRARFKGQPVELIGSSMGAYVAVHAAAAAPELFSGLVLLGATATPEADIARFAALEETMLRDGPKLLAPKIAQTMFGETSLRERPELVDKWAARFAQADKSIADTMRAIYMRTDMRPLFAKINLPMLLLAGAEDRARRPDEMTQIAVDKPGSFFCSVPGAGHTPALEQPAFVASAISAWWQHRARLAAPQAAA